MKPLRTNLPTPMLRVREVAKRLRCTEVHVVNLIESGRLIAIDVAAGGPFLIVPAPSIPAIAKLTRLPVSAIHRAIKDSAPFPGRRRAWRIPVEALEVYLKEYNSLSEKTL